MIPKDLRDCLASVMLAFLTVCVHTIHCKYSISHLLIIDVHLYKFFTCLDINEIRLEHGGFLSNFVEAAIDLGWVYVE